VLADELRKPADAAAIPEEGPEREEPHQFETGNIHPDLPANVRKLFDDG
jgi:hypothetical protein